MLIYSTYFNETENKQSILNRLTSDNPPLFPNGTIYTFPQKKLSSENRYYSYALNYELQQPKQCVLFSSVELGSNGKPKYDLINHIRMYLFFQTHFNFTAIIFSNSPPVKILCHQYNITIVDHYRTNKYGMPLIRDLYQQAYHLIRSRFYGYVNGDIIMSSNLFHFLSDVERRVQNNEIPENVFFIPY